MRNAILPGLVTLACLLSAPVPAAAWEETYIDQRLVQMDEMLDLSAEQSARVRQIVEDAIAQIAIDRGQLQEDRSALHNAIGRALREADKQIDEVLDEGQREKFVEFRKTSRADIMTLDLQERLDLTEAQTAEAYGILFEAERQIVKMRDEMGRDGGGRGGRGGGMPGMREVVQDTDKKIEKILTDEQKAMYQEIKDERRARMRESMGQQGGGRGGRGGGGFGRP